MSRRSKDRSKSLGDLLSSSSSTRPDRNAPPSSSARYGGARTSPNSAAATATAAAGIRKQAPKARRSNSGGSGGSIASLGIPGEGFYDKDGARISQTRVTSLEGFARRVFANGDSHEGSYKGGRRTGYGIYRYNNGDKYEGQWEEGHPEGVGEFTWALTSERYVGDFVKGQMTGWGIRDSPSGCITGNFVAGLVCGWAKKEYKNSCVYDGYWVDNVKEGFGMYLWTPNGERYNGHWTRDEMSGMGEFKKEKRIGIDVDDVVEYMGEYSRNMRHGYGRGEYANLNVYVGNW
jgi:hypothetical protein